VFSHLIVPVDPWATSTRSIPIAAQLAAAVGATVEIVTVASKFQEQISAQALDEVVAGHGPLAVDVTQHVVTDDSISKALAARYAATPGSMIVMTSHGRGRSASVLGSTTTELLAATGAPIIVVGPDVAEGTIRTDGPYLVPLDGSERADSILPVVADWSQAFGSTPWLVAVLDPDTELPPDVLPTAALSRRGDRLEREIGRPVQYDALRHHRPGPAVVEFANQQGASLIFAATHGRTGAAVLRAGSVAADIVRHAPCPVVMLRPSDLGAPDTTPEPPQAG